MTLILMMLIFSLMLYSICAVMYLTQQYLMSGRWFVGLGLLADLVLVLALLLSVVPWLIS